MNPHDLLSLDSQDPRIQDLLAVHGVPPSRLKPKRGDFDVGIEVAAGGFDLVFTLVEAIPSQQSSGHPKGSLVLSAVFLYPGADEGRPGFKQELPAGLSFNLNRDEVSGILGTPDSTSPVFPNDRWERDDGSALIVDFSEDGEHIQLLTIQISDA